MNTFELSSGDRKVAGCRSSSTNQSSIKFFLQMISTDIYSDMSIGAKNYTLLFHQSYSAVKDCLLQLKIWNAVPQEPTNPVATFKDCDPMSSFIQLGSCSQAGRSGTYNGDALSRTHLRRICFYVPFLECLFRNRLFNVFNCYGLIIDAENTTSLTGSRTNSPRKLGEIISTAQNTNCILPFSLINRVVKIRYIVSKRATVVTKRNPTVHTTRSLLLNFFFIKRCINFFIIFYPFFSITRFWHLTIELHKTINLSHAMREVLEK